MKKAYIRIFVATLLLLGACKTQKPVINDSVSQAPVEIIQPKADSIIYNYSPPRNYSVPKKIFKELENYETAFDELKAMLEGSKEPNFERAVFLSENPHYNNQHNYKDFQGNIDNHIYFIKKLIETNDKSDSIDFNVKVNQYGRFNLDDIRHMPDEKKSLYKKSLANWAIFKYLTDTIYSVLPGENLSVDVLYHTPFTYASHDPFGKKDWANSQVINLLVSDEQKGNCFALTAFYKILADRLNADARLCTAPQHIYIQHRDKKGDYYNVELATAGHPGDGTIQTLTHTTTEAIKSGIALRSFDTKQSIGLCLVNLAKSYEHKFGSKDDDFLLKCAELVLKHDPLNLNALLLKQQILDVRVTTYAIENNISDINKLKTSKEISTTVYDLENHLELLYRLGYRQMPFDMQEIIMTGVIPENFEDKNPSPFTTIVPKEEHKRKFTTLYGGLFQEVFEIREFEPYGHFTFQTTTNKITLIDTTAQTGFLIDPVAFAYDFGARMYDARLGIFTSVDPLAHQFASWSPYAAFKNNPIIFIDPDGRAAVNVNGDPPYEKWNKLNSKEKNIILWDPQFYKAKNIEKNANKAFEMTKETFGHQGKGDKSDAFRHAYWNALNTQSVGEGFTQKWGDAHEYSTPVEEVKTDLYMDIHNNAVGVEIGKANPKATPEELKAIILDRIDKGDLLIINENNKLIKSDGGIIKTGEIRREDASKKIATEIIKDNK